MNHGSQVQGTLAKLLSKENITIQRGNYTTAFFDPKNRILGLPTWKDSTKDLDDLFVGHEVGHALFTPHEFAESAKVARLDYVNVIEDIRIERMIQSTYPGLLACFKRGYSELLSRDFFGVKGKDISSKNLADRINLKAKCRDQIEVPFSSVEQKFFDKLQTLETWDEVISAALELEKMMGDAKKQQNKDKEAQADSESPGDMPRGGEQADGDAESGHSPEGQKKSKNPDEKISVTNSIPDDTGDNSKEQDNSAVTQKDSTDKPADSSTNTKPEESPTTVPTEKGESDKQSSESAPGTSASKSGVTNSPDSEVTTQNSFNKSADKARDTSEAALRTMAVIAPSRAACLDLICSYSELAAARARGLHLDYAETMRSQLLKTEFAEFMTSTKRVVASMVKEFELRKKAHQYSRATVARTGSLNIDKLHAYKVSDELFLSVTKLADAKSHGLIMLVDYSGSMSGILGNVLRQTINLALFCRAAAIPFQVYGFTGGNPWQKHSAVSAARADVQNDSILLPGNVCILDLVNSSMSKTTFTEAIYNLFARSRPQSAHIFNVGAESLGGTPLNEVLIATHYITQQFKETHKIDKTTVVFLTDGEGSSLAVERCKALDQYREVSKLNPYNYITSVRFKLMGRTISSQLASHYMTPALIQNLRITMGVEVIGFYLPCRNSKAQSILRDANMFCKKAEIYAYSAEQLLKDKKCYDSYRKDGVSAVAGAFNYSNFFVIKPSGLSIEDEDLEIEANASRKDIARAFMNFTQTKKTSRVFITKFAEAIA